MLEFQIYEGQDSDKNEKWRWRLLDKNNDNSNIARSEEPFLKTSIKRSIKTLKQKINTQTKVYEKESKEKKKGYRFEWFTGKDDKFYWCIKAGNNEPMAIGGEGFSNEEDMLKDIDNIKNNIINAKIEFEDPKCDPSYSARNDDLTELDESIPAGSFKNKLKELLGKYAIEYEIALNDELGVTKTQGTIVIMKDYYPDDDDSFKVSIALSLENEDTFEPKCWLSCEINNLHDSAKPKTHEEYERFHHNSIQYYPYSISISNVSTNNIIKILNGLHKFCREEKHDS